MTLNYLTATPRDVIARSHLVHPSLLADTLRATAKVHRDYARVTTNADVAVIARGMAGTCDKAIALLADDDIDGIMAHTGRWVIVLHEACKLLCVPPSCRGDIAARGQANLEA